MVIIIGPTHRTSVKIRERVCPGTQSKYSIKEPITVVFLANVSAEAAPGSPEDWHPRVPDARPMPPGAGARCSRRHKEAQDGGGRAVNSSRNLDGPRGNARYLLRLGPLQPPAPRRRALPALRLPRLSLPEAAAPQPRALLPLRDSRVRLGGALGAEGRGHQVGGGSVWGAWQQPP